MATKAVAVIGGGVGTDLTLQGLKRYTGRLTALISTADANRRGTGPGEETAVLAGDGLVASLLALGSDAATTQIMERLFAYRLHPGGEAPHRTFGHLFLSALTEITGASDRAVQAAAQVLNVQGRVLPLSLDACTLVADLLDGREVPVRTPAELSALAAAGGLGGVRLAHPVPALDVALEVIAEADIIVLGPSDFFFNVLAPLQIEGVRKAIAASPAIKIFVCNLLTQAHTTAGWPASRFIRRVLEALGGAGALDYVILSSSAALPPQAAHGEGPVRLDLDECLALGLNIIARPVSSPLTHQHDPEKLARTILALGGARVPRPTDRADAALRPPLGSLHPFPALASNGAET